MEGHGTFPSAAILCYLLIVPLPCRALQQKARVDQALTELDQQRAAHMKQDSELQEARAVAEKNAANIQPVRWCHVAVSGDIGFGPSGDSPRFPALHMACALQLQGGSCG